MNIVRSTINDVCTYRMHSLSIKTNMHTQYKHDGRMAFDSEVNKMWFDYHFQSNDCNNWVHAQQLYLHNRQCSAIYWPLAQSQMHQLPNICLKYTKKLAMKASNNFVLIKNSKFIVLLSELEDSVFIIFDSYNFQFYFTVI